MNLSHLVKTSAITFGLCLSHGWALAAEDTSSGGNQVKKETSNMIWLGIKTGFSQSDLDGLDEWLTTEGLSKTNQTSIGHGLLGFDLMFELGRIPIGLSPTFHLTGQDVNLTLIDITLQSGYTIIKRDEFNLKALGGIGLAYASLNFDGIPKSFESIAEDYFSPYPRLSAFNLRPSLMLSYTPFHRRDADTKGNTHNQVIFYFQAGFNYFFGHRWEYGEVSNNSFDEEDSFSGVTVNMPDVLRSNWFLSLGVAFAMEDN